MYAYATFPHEIQAKGLGDVVSLNPWKNIKNAAQSLKKGGNPLDAGASLVGIGGGLLPSTINKTVAPYMNPLAPAYNYSDDKKKQGAASDAAASQAKTNQSKQLLQGGAYAAYKGIQ